MHHVFIHILTLRAVSGLDAASFLVALCLWAVLIGAVLLHSFLGQYRQGYCGMRYNDGKELSSLVWVLLVLFVRSFTQKVDIKACIIHFLLYLCVNNKHNSQLSP